MWNHSTGRPATGAHEPRAVGDAGDDGGHGEHGEVTARRTGSAGGRRRPARTIRPFAGASTTTSAATAPCARTIHRPRALPVATAPTPVANASASATSRREVRDAGRQAAPLARSPGGADGPRSGPERRAPARRGSRLARRHGTATGPVAAREQGEVRDGVELKHLDGELFDGAGVTKRDLVDYLDAVAAGSCPSCATAR